MHILKKGYIKKERERLAELQERIKTSELNENELLQMRMPYSQLFIAREELLSSALTHPAIRHPSKYIYT